MCSSSPACLPWHYFGSYKNERLAQDSVDRLMRSKLAKTIAGDTAAIGQNVATMIFEKSAGEEAMKQILAVSKSRAEAMDQFKKSADHSRSDSGSR